MTYGKLAYTGMGTLTVGGLAIDQWGFLGLAAGLIVAGAVAIRLGWRRGKKVGTR